MYCSTTVNKPFTERVSEARPLSHVAAATLLCTSVYMVHSGATIALEDAPGLITATTLASAAIEWLQWTALGRIAKAEKAGEDNRAGLLKLQSIGIGVLQVILYTIAVVGYAAQAGANWGEGWPLFGAVVVGAMFAGLGFIVKWTSCERIEERRANASAGPNGGTRAPIDAAIFGAPRLAAPERSAPARISNVSNIKERVSRHHEDRANRQALLDAGRNTHRDEHGRFAPRVVAG
jgi:hypothetical protein